MFWFMLIALVVVVAAVALAVLGDGGVLSDAEPDRLHDPLPDDRPLGRPDIEALRLPTALRGYRMTDVDDVLDRVGAELTERDARIAELEAALAGAKDAALGGPSLHEPAPYEPQQYGPPRHDPAQYEPPQHYNPHNPPGSTGDDTEGRR